MEAEVLEQHHAGRRRRALDRRRAASPTQSRRTPPAPEQLAQPRRHRLQAEYSGFGLPFGRPRCDARITVAPCSSACRMVGSDADARVVGDRGRS
jgi:hypothetical protein